MKKKILWSVALKGDNSRERFISKGDGINLATRWRLFFIMYLVMLLGLPVAAAEAVPEERLPKGQLVYVPVYSHVYYGDYEHKILLTGILSIRNPDPGQAITLTRAD